ncbi:MAG: BON domain-containing protein [Polyangiaceae bacterium]
MSALLPSACTQSTPSPAPEAGATASASASASALVSSRAQHSDTEVQQAVLAELRKDPHLDVARIQVAATHGLIELSGTLDNLVSRERATRIAEVVRGVNSVANRIEVEAPARDAADIAADVRKALKYNAATARMPIVVSVTNGVVRLTGSIGSWQEQQLAERVADGVRGVRFCQNDLTTTGAPKRTAALIQADVESRLAWDALVEHDPITAKVKGDRVSLSGTTGSAAERLRVINDAWVAGVMGVDADAVTVSLVARPDANLRAGASKSDHQIAQAIKSAAFYDPRVRSFSVDPTVVDGVATLNGTVATPGARLAAEALARNTVGVRTVKNELVVRVAQTTPDKLLQKQVQDALLLDSMTDARNIQVLVDKGAVTLTGSIASYFDSAEALDVASGVPGVTRINNQLQVMNPAVPYVYSPWADPFTPNVEAWYVTSLRPTLPDATIAQRIKENYSWSPFILEPDVQVQVQDGTATLTGTVHSYRERQAAVDNALEAGAVKVTDELRLGSG